MHALPPTPRHALLLAALPVVATSAQAGKFARGAYDKAKADIRAIYQDERERCSALAGPSRDLCIALATGRETVALAKLDYNFSGRDEDERRLREARARLEKVRSGARRPG